MKKAALILSFLFLLGFSEVVKAQQLTIYQYYNATLHRHFYTTDHNELGPGGSQGFVPDGSIGQLNTAGIAIYRFYNSSTGAHYYTTRQTIFPSGFHFESILGYQPVPPFIVQPIYEFYNTVNHDYYYGRSSTVPSSGYVLNGIAYYAI